MNQQAIITRPPTHCFTYGDTGVGKSGMAERLVHNKFVKTDSTHARRALLLESEQVTGEQGTIMQRDTVLWDLAGQPDYDVTFLGVDGMGRLDLDELRDALRPDTAVVSVMAANNETGVIFPIEEIGAIVKEAGAIFHVDSMNGVFHGVITPTGPSAERLE